MDDDDWHWEWIGYGVYRLNVKAIGPGDTYTFYIDHLDSNYPSEKDEFGDPIYDDVDIHVDYDFSRTLGQRVVLWTNDATFTNVNGKLYTVWDDLFNPSQPRATEFYLHGTVPLPTLSSDQLFCSVIIDDDITVASGKSLVIESDLYPDINKLERIILQAEFNKKLTINGTLTVGGQSNKSILFDRSGASGTWDGIKFNSGSSGTIAYATIKYAKKAVHIKSTNNATVKNSIIEHFTEQGIYAEYAAATIDNNTIKNPSGASHGIYVKGKPGGSAGADIKNNTFKMRLERNIPLKVLYLKQGCFSGDDDSARRVYKI